MEPMLDAQFNINPTVDGQTIR